MSMSNEYVANQRNDRRLRYENEDQNRPNEREDNVSMDVPKNQRIFFQIYFSQEIKIIKQTCKRFLSRNFT